MSSTYIERLPQAAELLTRAIVAERIALIQHELGRIQDLLTEEWSEDDSSTFRTREEIYGCSDMLRGVAEALALRDTINYRKRIEEERDNGR